jgi:hypothetical protein
MKNYLPFLFFLLMVISIESSGQKGTYITPVGITQRTVIYNRQEQQYKYLHENLPSYAAAYGLSIRHTFTSKISIEYGLFGSKQEQHYKIHAYANGPIYGDGDGRKRLIYIKIPVLFRGNILAKTNTNLFFTVGPQLSMLLSEDGGIPIYVGRTPGIASDTLIAYSASEADGGYRTFTLDGVGSIGWEIKVYRDVYFQTQFRIDYSLTDVENKSYSTAVGKSSFPDAYYLFSRERPSTHNITAGLLFGLSFKIR